MVFGILTRYYLAQYGHYRRPYHDVQVTKIEKNMRKSVIKLCILQKDFTFAALNERSIEHHGGFRGLMILRTWCNW
jgi:hypothetical protein